MVRRGSRPGSTGNLEQPRGEWKRQREPTSSCIPLDRLGDELTPTAHEHVAHCVRCQTEMTLWRDYESAGSSPAEGAAVQWIVAEIGRRTAAARTPRRSAWSSSCPSRCRRRARGPLQAR
jgi:hypothetical protein